MLLTNDGELAHRLMHPRFGVEKTYHVQVAGAPTRDDLNRLRLLQIERHGLAPPRGDVEAQVSADRAASAREAIDADDLRTHVGKHHRAERTGAYPGHLENAETLQRPHALPDPIGRMRINIV